MKSGYVEESASKTNRPPLTIFGPGFFAEDFTYKEKTDETVLDANNGRFCVTPQYPNGVYAYFATVELGSTTNQIESKYPYLS